MEYIYAALLLHKLGQQVTEDSMNKVISSCGVQVDEAKVKTLLAALNGVDLAAELANASAVSMAAPAASGAAPKKEEKKEEAPSESAAGLSSLFG
jgi:large subunit ribosomal protein L12